VGQGPPRVALTRSARPEAASGRSIEETGLAAPLADRSACAGSGPDGRGSAPVDSDHHPNIMGAMLRTRRRAATVDRIAAWIVDAHVDPGSTLPIEPDIGNPAAGAEGIGRAAAGAAPEKGHRRPSRPAGRDPLGGPEARA
jgi:hypothetical protein